MLIVHRRSFFTGLVMALGFAGVLVLLFTPILGERTPLKAADDLFNSVSKQSSYYIPLLRKRSDSYRGTALDTRVSLLDEQTAQRAAALLAGAGAQAAATGAEVTVRGDLGRVLGAALDDADASFHNEGEALAARRGAGAKEVMFAWWSALKQVAKQARAASDFKKASDVEEVMSKGIEVSYNYYGIVPSPAARNVGVLALALFFYLLYTVWWGYAILWLCDGIGLQMKASGKREH